MWKSELEAVPYLCGRLYMYDDGILRMSSVPFNLNSLRDPFVHLTNHCIQKKHDKYVNRYSWIRRAHSLC